MYRDINCRICRGVAKRGVNPISNGIKDSQSRKWHLVLNNPKDSGFTHDKIKDILLIFKSLVYYCLSDEIGQTLHTHLFIAFSSGVRFSTIKRAFPTAHIEIARGTCKVNRDYCNKENKWADDDKHGTKIEGTFEEWGEMPVERQGTNNIFVDIVDRIRDGATNAELLVEFPDQLRALRDFDYVRQSLKAEEYRDKWRDLTVKYIFGETGLGKTRYVMEKHGYRNVCQVTDYKRHPFDDYQGQEVLLLEDFDSSLNFQLLLNVTDGHPIALPARFTNRQACYDKVYIISNLPLKEQYPYIKTNQLALWDAFIRRIHKVIRFFEDGTRREYITREYLDGEGRFTELPPDTWTPWDDEPPLLPESPPYCKQISLLDIV